MVTEVRPIANMLAAYERDHEYARLVTLPVEERNWWRPPGHQAHNGFRWFSSHNIVDLDLVRRLLSEQSLGRTIKKQRAMR